MECPTCGQPCSRDIPEQFADEASSLQKMFRDRGANLTRMQARLLTTIRGKNRPIAYQTIFDQVYGWRPDGDCPQDETLKVMATKCRQAIVAAGLPWRIICHWGIGYELDETGTKKAIKRMAFALVILLPLGQAIASRIG